MVFLLIVFLVFILALLTANEQPVKNTVLTKIAKPKFNPVMKLILLTVVLSLHCNTTEPPLNGDNPTLTLNVEDVSCVEAFINIKLNGIALPADVVLTRNNVNVQNFVLTNNDTVIIDDNLSPKQTYTYIATVTNGSKPKSSKPVTALTMDTTSHNFTWQMFTLGSSASVLSNVFIIDENNIWAVGKINTPYTYTYDSLGNFIPPYNIAHWNGVKWQLKRVFFYTICGQSVLTAYPAGTIHVFENNEMWIGMGDQFAILKDGNQIDKFCLPTAFSVEIRKLSGKSSNNFYAIGYGGTILYYNGTHWTKIPSGTNVKFLDLVALNNNKDIYCIGSNYQPPYNNTLLKITGTTAQHINITGLPLQYQLKTIWAVSDKRFYLGGDGLYEGKLNDFGITLKRIVPDLLKWWTWSITGTGYNDIFVSGYSGELAHFNGVNWREYKYNQEIPSFYGGWHKVVVKGDIVCAVGDEGGALGKILLGRRVE